MADIKTTEEIGLDLQKRKLAKDLEDDPDRDPTLTKTESWVVSVPAEDINFKSNVDLLTLEECDHLLQIVTSDTKLRAIRKRRIEIAGTDIPEPTSTGRILAEPDSWENEGFRARIAEILAGAQYPFVAPEEIDFPLDHPGKFQYRRFRERDDLFDSILRNGVFEEITLQKPQTEGAKHSIIDGNTRFKEWLRAREQDPSIPTPVFRVLDCSDADAAQIAIVLNQFGQNLDDEDTQACVIRLVEEAGMKQKDIAELLEMSEGYISDIVAAFQKVPAEARALIENRRWTVKHGKILARLFDYPKEQEKALKLAINNGWTTAQLDERVKKDLLQKKFESDAEKIIDDVVEGTTEPGKQLKQVTSIQADEIHSRLEKRLGSPSTKSWGGKRVLKDGTVEANMNPSTTKKILKAAGYTIVPSKSKTTESTEVETKEQTPTVPIMPDEEELMECSQKDKTCFFCNGPVHPVVAETIGFETETIWDSEHHYAHYHCYLKNDINDIIEEIEDMKKQLADREKELEQEALSQLMKRENLTLEAINNKAHGIYKDELEKRKQQWRIENIDPDSLIGKGVHVGEPMVKSEKTDGKPTDLELLLQVRVKQPDLVKECFFDAYQKKLHGTKGYQSHRQVMKSIGSSKGSTTRAFQAIEAAIADLREAE